MKSLATAMISGFLFQNAVLANEVLQILGVSNGQQGLIERNGEGRALRLACLQAPRSRQQPWADQAAASLRALVQPGDQVHFELRSRDVNGRLVGRLLIEGRDVGAELVGERAVFPWNGDVGQCDDLDDEAVAEIARKRGLCVWSVAGGGTAPTGFDGSFW